MDFDQIIPVVYLIGVLILVLPSFLQSNSKLKQFLANLSIWVIVVLIVTTISYFLFKQLFLFSNFVEDFIVVIYNKNRDEEAIVFKICFEKLDYIHTLITPILAYLRSSLQSSLKEWSFQKASRKIQIICKRLWFFSWLLFKSD